MGQAGKNCLPGFPLHPQAGISNGDSEVGSACVGQFGPLRLGMVDLCLDKEEGEPTREGATGLG